MQESLSFSPNSLMASATRRRILNPSLILRCIYFQMKAVIYGVQAEACGLLEMEVSSACRDHRGLVCVVMPSST